MTAQKRRKQVKRRGHRANTQGPEPLAGVVRDTARLWRKHHLDYDQTKYVVAQARHRLALQPPRMRRRTVERLEKAAAQRQRAYQWALANMSGL